MLGNDHFKPFPNIAKLLYQKNSAHSKSPGKYQSPGKYRDFVYSLEPCFFLQGSFFVLLFEIFYSGFEDLLIFLSVNIDSYIAVTTF
jgi:hypothetical protein